MGRGKKTANRRKLAVGMLVEARCSHGGYGYNDWYVCRVAKVHENESKLLLEVVDSQGRDIGWFAFWVRDSDVSKTIMAKPAERNGDYRCGNRVHVLGKLASSTRTLFFWEPTVVMDVIDGKVQVQDPEERLLYKMVDFDQIRMAHHVAMHVHCRRAALCFLWFWRRVCGFQKDVGRLIAQLVWASRDYRCWQM